MGRGSAYTEMGAGVMNYLINGNNQYLERDRIRAGDATTDNRHGNPRIADETRPKNVALLFCIKL